MLSIGYGELGGVGTVTQELTEALNVEGSYQADVLTFWPWPGKESQNRFSFIDADGKRTRYTTLEDFMDSAEGRRIDYDVVHLHSHIFADSYLRMVGSSTTTADFLNRYKAPKILLAHCLAAKTNGVVPNQAEVEAQRQIMGLSDIVVHLTKDQEEIAGKCYPEFKSKTVVIGNGVSEPLPIDFEEVFSLKKQLAPNGERLGLYLGRLSKEKGIEELVEALPMIKARDQNFKLIIAGNRGSHYDLHIERRLTELGLVENKDFQFLGWINDERIKQKVIQAVDFTIMPSYYEHFPMTALESMINGTPVIISDVEGVRNIFRLNDQSQRLAMPINGTMNPKAIAEAVSYALTHDQELGQIAGRALAQTHSEFNWRKIVRKYHSLYSRLIGDSASETKSDEPKVGIIIPTYNRREAVIHTIDSFLAQNTTDRYKIIVVDDGSIDGTLEVLKERYSLEIDYVEDTITKRKESIRGSEGKIIVIRQRNKHVSAARNKGLETAYELGCNFFTIQDAGDKALPNKINDLKDHLEQNPEVSLVHAKSKDVDKEGEPLPIGYEGYYRPLWERMAKGEKLSLEKENYVHNQTIMFRRKVIDRLSLDNLYWEQLRFGEDYDFCLKAERAGLIFGFCDKYVAESVGNADGLTRLSNCKDLPPTEIAALAYQALDTSEKRELYKTAIEKNWNCSEADSRQFGDYFEIVFGLKFEREFYLRMGNLGRAITLADEVVKLQPTEENREILSALTWRCF